MKHLFLRPSHCNNSMAMQQFIGFGNSVLSGRIAA
jgi:hypothetical protein